MIPVVIISRERDLERLDRDGLGSNSLLDNTNYKSLKLHEDQLSIDSMNLLLHDFRPAS